MLINLIDLDPGRSLAILIAKKVPIQQLKRRLIDQFQRLKHLINPLLDPWLKVKPRQLLQAHIHCPHLIDPRHAVVTKQFHQIQHHVHLAATGQDLTPLDCVLEQFDGHVLLQLLELDAFGFANAF